MTHPSDARSPGVHPVSNMSLFIKCHDSHWTQTLIASTASKSSVAHASVIHAHSVTIAVVGAHCSVTSSEMHRRSQNIPAGAGVVTGTHILLVVVVGAMVVGAMVVVVVGHGTQIDCAGGANGAAASASVSSSLLMSTKRTRGAHKRRRRCQCTRSRGAHAVHATCGGARRSCKSHISQQHNSHSWQSKRLHEISMGPHLHQASYSCHITRNATYVRYKPDHRLGGNTCEPMLVIGLPSRILCANTVTNNLEVHRHCHLHVRHVERARKQSRWHARNQVVPKLAVTPHQSLSTINIS